MPYIQYGPEQNLRPATLALINWADGVATDYASRGLGLTLRQLYYQGVSANVFPNREESYKRLGNAVTAGRMAGLIDWNHLTDRTRNAHGTGWEHSTEFPEIADLVRDLRSSMAHDPSGIDMSRDIEERASMFGSTWVEVKRVALNFDQIEEFDPPPNPAKQTDSRFADYEARFGSESWELDALRPEMLIELLTDTVGGLLDEEGDREAYDQRIQEETDAEEKVGEIADRWEEIERYLEENPL